MGGKIKKPLIHRVRHDIIKIHISLDEFVFSDFS